jgi:large subunit ribosomal protein L6
MSRVGKKPIEIPKNVKVEIKDATVKIEGPKGKWDFVVPKPYTAEVSENSVIVKRPSDLKKHKMMHGTIRSILSNAIKGVFEGYHIKLEIVGVGYKAQVQGKKLNVQLGFTHVNTYDIPDGVNVKIGKPTEIEISGVDKMKVGKVAAEVRAFFPPEPYKGKGVRYADEFVRRKAGKAIA